MPENREKNRTEKTEKRIFVEFSPDRVEVFITLGNTIKLAPITEKEIVEELAKSAVVENLIYEEIKRLIQSQTPGVKVAVARGVYPKPGINGKIQYFFDYESMGKPRLDAQGRADHKNINLIINVKPGDKLAKIHPPVSGTPGRTATGELILPPEPEESRLYPGPGTAFSNNDPSIIVASAEGAVAVCEGTIRVDPVMEIPGNVDYTTGNIDFKGTLTVKGDVKSGFSVKSEGNILITGIVEDANVIAGGNITVISGCVGTGKGILKAGGSVFIRFAERQRIRAHRDVVAEEYLLNSSVIAGNAVTLVEKQGLILGGEVAAGSSVTAKVMGNRNGITTTITVGYNDEVLEKLKTLSESERNILDNMKKVRKGFDILKRIKIIKRTLPDDKKALLIKLADISKKLHDGIEDVRIQREKIISELKRNEEINVTVLDAVYPGVSIFFREIGYQVENKEERVIFRFQNGEIQKSSAK